VARAIERRRSESKMQQGLSPLDYAEGRNDVPDNWAGLFKELILEILEVQNTQDSVRVVSQEDEDIGHDRESAVLEVENTQDSTSVISQEDEDNDSEREIFEDALEVHEVPGNGS